ncbi:zinc metalloprotease [Nonlabens sp. YIK11]|uniref:RIP metalloprotease RseP n=1 Tax=Nonlabens sp. YIK11 TaxID=1453349 RepID=UPI0006DC1167|nr:RIP metalloprotease RseP [Nonlabens sp. YIK11]KQC32498.1 zinc metalloprotease [Nonlabens sp. YIK11]
MHPTIVLIINFLMSLSLLIVLHELGHFIPARLFKIKVEKFYLFFDIKFSLFKKKIGETVYGIGWLPLGGYVKIAGMIDESMDKEQMALPPQPWEFRSKPAWQRLIVMLGGVIVNVLVGFIIYAGIMYSQGTQVAHGDDFKYGFGYSKTLEEVGFMQGDQPMLINGDTLENALDLNKMLVFRDVETVTVLRNGAPVEINIPEDIGDRMFEDGIMGRPEFRYPFAIDSIAPGMLADSLGLKQGDDVIAVAGKPIEFQTDFTYAMNYSVEPDQPFILSVLSNGNQRDIELTLSRPEIAKGLGVYTNNLREFADVSVRNYSIGESLVAGISRGYWTMHDYIAQFKYVFTKKGAGQLGGFGTIAKLYPDTFNWIEFWGTTALISFILAVMNILPIPALDGGHVMFLLYEIVTGRKPGDKFMERAQIIGILILLVLMLYANGNDVYKWLFG